MAVVVTIGDLEFASQVWWYTSRAAGIVAWVLLSGSMIAGLALSSRDAKALPAGWMLDLHRYLSTLSLTFLTIHLVALVPDNFVHFGWAELFVPMASEWQPGAVAWGIVAFWLVVCVEISSLARARIPHRLWRAIHFTSFAIWVAATVHLFTAGTDVSHPAFRVAQVVAIGAVSAMFVRRLATVVLRRRRRSPLPVEEPVDVDQVDSGKRAELST